MRRDINGRGKGRAAGPACVGNEGFNDMIRTEGAVPRCETYRDASSPLSHESGLSIRIRLGGEMRRGHRHSRAPKLVVLRLLRLVLDPPVSEWPGSRAAEGLSDQTNGRESEASIPAPPINVRTKFSVEVSRL